MRGTAQVLIGIVTTLTSHVVVAAPLVGPDTVVPWPEGVPLLSGGMIGVLVGVLACVGFLSLHQLRRSGL